MFRDFMIRRNILLFAVTQHATVQWYGDGTFVTAVRYFSNKHEGFLNVVNVRAVRYVALSQDQQEKGLIISHLRVRFMIYRLFRH